MEVKEKQRIIQEFVPGKQVTMAHIIANPKPEMYRKLGVVEHTEGALGVLTITPSEGAIVAADVASKKADISLVFVDRFSGSLVISGELSGVDTAMHGVIDVLEGKLGFTPTEVTFT